jgi:hypothetical protein
MAVEGIGHVLATVGGDRAVVGGIAAEVVLRAVVIVAAAGVTEGQGGKEGGPSVRGRPPGRLLFVSSGRPTRASAADQGVRPPMHPRVCCGGVSLPCD